MQVKCAYSGITFTCEHFPASVSSKELVHPVFYLKPAKLLSLSTMWAEGKLTTTDSYLLFLALLDSTGLVQFRTSVLRSDKTSQILALNMEQLVSLCTKILHVPAENKSKILPSFAISSGSDTLDNVGAWLGTWQSALDEYVAGYKGAGARNKLIATESLLHKYIKDSSLHPSKYSNLLANWAEIAGNFPSGETLLPGGQKIPLNLYWKNLITKAALDDSIFTVSQKDLEELIGHCEENIPHGSIYAHSLMKVLRDALAAQVDFFRGGATAFKVLSSPSAASSSTSSSSVATSSGGSEDVGSLNVARIIESAPAREPARGEYDSLVSFLKAKMAWNLAQSASTAGTATAANSLKGN